MVNRIGSSFAIIDKTKYSRQSLIITSFGVIFLTLTVMASIQRDVSKPNINLNVVTSINSTLKTHHQIHHPTLTNLTLGAASNSFQREGMGICRKPERTQRLMRKGNITTLWPFDYKLIRGGKSLLF